MCILQEKTTQCHDQRITTVCGPIYPHNTTNLMHIRSQASNKYGSVLLVHDETCFQGFGWLVNLILSKSSLNLDWNTVCLVRSLTHRQWWRISMEYTIYISELSKGIYHLIFVPRKKTELPLNIYLYNENHHCHHCTVSSAEQDM